jgi:ATP-binding cassette subfamily C (CFTR/MRP) protein 1
MSVSIFISRRVTLPLLALKQYHDLLFTQISQVCLLLPLFALVYIGKMIKLQSITCFNYSESLTGTTTIRAYKKQEMFSSRLEHFANLNTVPALLQQLSLQWLSIRLDFIGAVILFFMGSLTAALSQYSFIPAGFLALGLSYAISLTTVLKMVVRVLAQLEAHFSSVERIRHYIENDHGLDGRKRVPKIENTEASSAVVSSDDVEMAVLGTSNEDFTPPTQWPEFGKIEFRNVYMRYRDNGDCVLKGVSFTVDSLAKIGICGRTGYVNIMYH